jgi:hypothetical protein
MNNETYVMTEVKFKYGTIIPNLYFVVTLSTSQTFYPYFWSEDAQYELKTVLQDD